MGGETEMKTKRYYITNEKEQELFLAGVKKGRAKALADVEKIIEKLIFIRYEGATKFLSIEDIPELKMQIKSLETKEVGK